MAFFAAIAELFYGLYQEIRFRLYYRPIFDRFINHKYAYYTDLPKSLKSKFLHLMRDHYEYFEFVPRDMQLTRAMKALIACAAAQLLLFLPSRGLTYYKRIIVYPDYYNSMITHRKHKGEVNPGLKVIVFSWRGIVEGLQHESDGINLLLHEFAHALWLEQKIMAQHYQVLESTWVARFEQYAQTQIANITSHEDHFFRKYAFENVEEFFAVSVENFFERPDKFQQAQPELYHILVALFKQDPTKLYASYP